MHGDNHDDLLCRSAGPTPYRNLVDQTRNTQSLVGAQVEALPTGIYYGWACLPGRGVFKACASIGWNPQYQNEQKTVSALRVRVSVSIGRSTDGSMDPLIDRATCAYMYPL